MRYDMTPRLVESLNLFDKFLNLLICLFDISLIYYLYIQRTFSSYIYILLFSFSFRIARRKSFQDGKYVVVLSVYIHT